MNPSISFFAHRTRIAIALLLVAGCASNRHALAENAKADEGITWLVQFDGTALPDSATWKPQGTPKATIEEGALHLVDDSSAFGCYRANWPAGTDQEIIVDAKVQVGAVTGAIKGKSELSLWPWRDGAPVGLLVSDGRHQDGVVLFPSQLTNFTDRFVPMDTKNQFHEYRLVIRGTDMRMLVDGVEKVHGQGAFAKPADSPEAFIQFGSSAKQATGDARWAAVRLGVRKAAGPLKPNPLTVTISKGWEVTSREGVKQTRPYLNDAGKGLLLMSVAQGPDAIYEPYGLLKSTDAGQTWAPVEGLDQIVTTPLPVLRRPDGNLLASSRWTWLHDDGSVLGKTFHLDANATAFTIEESRIVLPKQYSNEVKTDQIIVERHIFNDEDGGATMVVWSRKLVPIPDGRKTSERASHLVKTTDNGKTWNYVSTIGPGGEPAVARLSGTKMTAVIRGARTSPMTQVFSDDSGKTWGKPITLEEGKVAPDLVMMSNGVLACSYGRPASCIMFSVDEGKTWCSHHVVSDRVGFNYCSIREISPGRLLFVHDAGKMNAVYIDVERTK
jgi:photosystem II stability/assembly factor-like uncharacterized protein